MAKKLISIEISEDEIQDNGYCLQIQKSNGFWHDLPSQELNLPTEEEIDIKIEAIITDNLVSYIQGFYDGFDYFKNKLLNS